MTESVAEKKTGVNARQYFIVSAVGWSCAMLLVMAFQIGQTNKAMVEITRIQAKIAYEKDLVFRKWGAMKGGVYAAVTVDTPPNPHLNVPERDITTPSGKRLTLINPAYMIRQVQELERLDKGVIGHLTSLNPIRAANAPDPWEKEGLLAFEKGATEFSSVETIDGTPYMRFMKPFMTEEGCLKCHAQQGYKLGDIRGAISTSVSMKDIKKIQMAKLRTIFGSYFVIWLLGIAGLGFGTNRLNRQLEERRRTEADLAEFKVTLDQSRDCVFMFYPDTLKFFYVNRGAIEQVGYLEEELLDMTPVDIKPNFTEETFREVIQPLLDGKETHLIIETTHYHKEGNLIPVEINLQYVIPKDSQGRFVAFVRDISNRKKAEDEKEKMQSRLLQSQKLESVGQLAAGIAHEINTPAQYVGTNIDFLGEAFQDVDELITSYQTLEKEAKEQKFSPDIVEKIGQTYDEVDWEYLAEEIPTAVNQSREGIHRVTKIVRAMKEFSHPGSSEKAPADLNAIIENTLTVASNEWKYAADVQLNLAPDLPSVSCFSDEMGQVFLNIIVNAAHAIAEKRGEGSEDNKGVIEIMSKQDGDVVEVRIKDDGFGMPDIIKDKIFDPFFTTKEVGKGTGQGLTIAHDVIADKHGGTIAVDSDIGMGTTFIIRLPVS
jgi:PAS domain S-box-containing protein